MKLIIALALALGYSTVSAKEVEIVLTDKNTVVLNQAFDASSVAEVQQKLSDLSSANERRDLYLVLDSPGGSITAGQSLIDFANSLPNKVHTITLFGASMAYLTAQHLDNRYVVPSARMMSHRARIGGLAGQVPGEAVSRLRHISSIVKELFSSTAKRVGVSYRKYMRLVYDELWLTGKQAVKYNHADAMAKVKCDKSLKGTTFKTVRTIFGAFKVEFSKCPLIRGPLSVDTDNEFAKNYIKNKLDFANSKYYRFEQ